MSGDERPARRAFGATMRRALACVGLIAAAGCAPSTPPPVHASSVAAPAAPTPDEPTPSDEPPAPEPVVAAPRAIALAGGTPFGCVVVPNLDGQLLRLLPESEAPPGYDPSTALPQRFHRRLTPSVDGLRVVGADGPCEPRRFAVRGRYELPGVTIVGETFGGCGAAVGSFAFAGCEVPAWLRYRRVEARIEPLPGRGPLEDPMLEALEARAGFTVEATEDESAAARRARLRRRYRRSSIRTAREELLVLELHHYLDLEGGDPCYADELVTTSVHLRRVDGERPGPWEEIHADGRVVGAYVDDEGRLVAFDTRRLTPASHRCAEDRQGVGFECDQLVLSSREGEVLSTYDYFYGYNATFHDAMSVLYWRRDCDHTG